MTGDREQTGKGTMPWVLTSSGSHDQHLTTNKECLLHDHPSDEAAEKGEGVTAKLQVPAGGTDPSPSWAGREGGGGSQSTF